MVSMVRGGVSMLVIPNGWYEHGNFWTTFRKEGTHEQAIKVLISASDHSIGVARSSLTMCISFDD